MSFIGGKILNHIFSGIEYPPPQQLWAAIFTANGEVVGGGYARINVTGKFSLADDNDIVLNNAQLEWPLPTVGWGNIEGMALYDASEGGNLIMTMPFDRVYSVPPGSSVFMVGGSVMTGFTLQARNA